MRKSYSTKQIIRFRCWSRKRYAAFCSLGRAVTIGCLSKGVTEIALGKQRGVIFSLLRFFREDGLEREEEDSGGILPGWVAEEIMLCLQPQVFAEKDNGCVGLGNLRSGYFMRMACK